eukprot:507810-Karenia_brevis.AAC.1
MMKSCDKGPVLNAMQKGLRETNIMHPQTGHIQTCQPLCFSHRNHCPSTTGIVLHCSQYHLSTNDPGKCPSPITRGIQSNFLSRAGRHPCT